ncbi:MAG: GntR family transcriptional regulator [Thermodesulfobacteriota bacterium]|nr:GntR family transcriptional regulator [Thermodesulfobacteriota bacterium]
MVASIRVKRPLNRSRLHEEIGDILLRDIVKGRIHTGERLPAEREMAHDLGVNRATVRSALKWLESLDLIEIRHGLGAVIKDYRESGSPELIRSLITMDGHIDEDILMGILEVRRIMVPQMASAAASLRTDTDLKDLEDAVFHSSELSVMERDILVHHIIAVMSNNLLYLVLLNFFNKFMRDFGYLYFEDDRNILRSQEFHQAIYEAIKKKNPKKAKKVMDGVLEDVERLIRETFNKSQGQGGTP